MILGDNKRLLVDKDLNLINDEGKEVAKLKFDVQEERFYISWCTSAKITFGEEAEALGIMNEWNSVRRELDEN